eukprot:CAMPEP_0177622496 /NCGR_PEP_ID=MMETSP0419_2-20121207/28294_1 /TAXON_ID=582737 /ORGANISM="Tetraselmis sp., Strain GSL018" /LENGTH=51 /DNA_ID=CAMNT_0019122773 /DNA_START=54 /DNA_END=206 /DNA_ORIENTATION=-
MCGCSRHSCGAARVDGGVLSLSRLPGALGPKHGGSLPSAPASQRRWQTLPQ